MAPTSSLVKAAATVPDYYTATTAVLSFTVIGADLLDEASWQLLEEVKGPTTKDNVGPVRFEYGLSISQQKSKATKCTVTCRGGQLQGAPIVKRAAKAGGPMSNVRVVVASTKKIKGPPAEKIYDDETIARHLKVHLTGNEMLNTRDRFAEISKKDSHALDVEHQAKLAVLGEKREELERTRAASGRLRKQRKQSKRK
ncbi:MAG: hypothetical protein Q9207_000639 [Kuettlingeria erythrocarpa]